MSDMRRLPLSTFWSYITSESDAVRSHIIDRRFCADYPQNYYPRSSYQEDFSHAEYQREYCSKNWQFRELRQCDWQQENHQPEYNHELSYQSSRDSRNHSVWRSNNSYRTCYQWSQSSFRRNLRVRDRAGYTAAKYLWPRERSSSLPSPDHHNTETLSGNSNGKVSTAEGTHAVSSEKEHADSLGKALTARKEEPHSSPKEELSSDCPRKGIATHEPSSLEKTDCSELPVKAEMISSREAKRPDKASTAADQCSTVGSTQERSPAQQTPTTSDVVRTSKESVRKSVDLTGERSPKSGDLKSYKIPKCHRPLVTGSKSETCQREKPRDQEKPSTESSGKNVRRSGHDRREHGNRPASDVNKVDSSTAAKERRKSFVDVSQKQLAHENNRKSFIPKTKFERDPREEVKNNATNSRFVLNGSGCNTEHLKRLTVKDYLNRDIENPDAQKRCMRNVTKHNPSLLSEVPRSNSSTRPADEIPTKNVSRVSSNTSLHSSPKEGSPRNDKTVTPKSSCRARESYDRIAVAPNDLAVSKPSPILFSAKELDSRKDVSKHSQSGQALSCKDVSRDIVASDHRLKPSCSAEACSRKSSFKISRAGESVSPNRNPRNSFIASPNTTSKSPSVEAPVSPFEVIKDLSKMSPKPSPKSSPTCQVSKVLADKLKNVPSSFTDFQEKFIKEVLPAAGLPVDAEHGEDVQQFVEQLTFVYSNGSHETPRDGKAANPISLTGKSIRVTVEPCSTRDLNSNDVRRGNRRVADSLQQTDTKYRSKSSTEFREKENSRRSVKSRNTDLDQPCFQTDNFPEFETQLRRLLNSKSECKIEYVAATTMPQGKQVYSSRSEIVSVLEDSSTPQQMQCDMYSPSSSSKSPLPILSPNVTGKKPGTAEVMETPAHEDIATVPAASLRIPELRKEELQALINRYVDDRIKETFCLHKSRSSHQSRHSSKRSAHRRHYRNSTRRHSSDSRKKHTVKQIERDSFTEENGKPQSEVKKGSSKERKSSTKRRSSSSSGSDVAISHKRRRRICAPLNESDTEENASPGEAIETGKTLHNRLPLPGTHQKPLHCTEEKDLVTPDQSDKHSSEVKEGSLNEHTSNWKRSRSSSASDSDRDQKRHRIRTSLHESVAVEDATSAEAIVTEESPQLSVQEQTPTRSTDGIDLATPDSSARVSICDKFSPLSSSEFDNIPRRVGSCGSSTDTASPAVSFVLPLTYPSVVSLKSVQVYECNSTSVPIETVEYIDISDAEDNPCLDMSLKSQAPSSEEPLESPEPLNDYPFLPSPAYSTVSTSSMRTVCIDNLDRKKQEFALVKKELAYEVISLSDDEDETAWNTLSELDKLKIKELSELYLECYRSLELFVTRGRGSYDYTEAVRVAVEDRSREELFKTFLPFFKHCEEKKKNLCKDFTEAEVFNLVDERLRTYELPPLGGAAGFVQMLGLFKQLNKRKTKKNWRRMESVPKPSNGLSIVEEVQEMLHLPIESDVRSPTAVAAARSTPLRTSADSSPEMIPIIVNVTSLDIKEEVSDFNGDAGPMLYEGYPPDITRTVDSEPLLEPSPSVAKTCAPIELVPSVSPVKREEKECLACGVPAEIKCSYCLDAHYCSRNCQTIHWNSFHQYYCDANTTVVL